jgi:hypothetical protein
VTWNAKRERGGGREGREGREGKERVEGSIGKSWSKS